MRKIIVQEFITLDGVMQAPGGSKEDEESGFKFGGWTAPYFNVIEKEAERFMERWMQSTDILLGRKTFDIFAGYWPEHEDMWPGINDVNKYVMSSSLDESQVEKYGWNNSKLVKTVDDIKALKGGDGRDIKVHGSSILAQTLFKHGLVDELYLMMFPIILGQGKRLFDENSIPTSFILTDNLVTSNGVIFGYYGRSGGIETGNVGDTE